MKLRYSATSPFVRKCVIVAAETGIALELVPTSPWAADTDLVNDNPLSKVPCLVTEGGEALYDSPVICEYLDSLHGGRKLVPEAGGTRWSQKRLEALGDGILDAAVAKRIEMAIRPEDKRWQGWIERQEAAIRRALDALEQDCAAWGDTFQIGQIAVACGLDYLDFRSPEMDWRKGRPMLADWFATVSRRPSMTASAPKE